MRTMAVLAVAALPVALSACGSNPGPGPAPSAAMTPVYQADSIDVLPVLLTRIAPNFPNRLREEYVGGTVWLEFIVDTRGYVEENSITVLCSTNDAFVTPASVARRRFRYNPGRLSNQPVRTRMRDNVRFVVTRRGVRQALPVCEPDPTAPAFFAAGRWVDRNQDERMTRDELEGLQSGFDSSERVIFVGEFDLQVGSQLQGVVKTPNGTTYATVHETLAYRKQLLSFDYAVRDLIAEHGPGQWVVEWYVGPRLAGTSRATLTR